MFIGDQLRPCHFMRDFNHFQFYFVLVLFDTHHFKRDFSLSYFIFSRTIRGNFILCRVIANFNFNFVVGCSRPLVCIRMSIHFWCQQSLCHIHVDNLQNNPYDYWFRHIYHKVHHHNQIDHLNFFIKLLSL